MPELIIALTFDGGPDGVPSGDFPEKLYNTTERVLNLLRAPGIDGVADVKAAFFVQTHVPARMARLDGTLGTGAPNYTHGQKLVKRMGAEGHIVGLLNGSARDLDRHDDQLAQVPPALQSNLARGVAELAPLMGLRGDGTRRPVEFLRSPFGFYTRACEAVYATAAAPLALRHAFWHTQAMGNGDNEGSRAQQLPPGDLCPGVPRTQKHALLRSAAQKAREKLRRKLAHSPDPPPPSEFLVVQLHDIAVVTAAWLKDIMEALLDSPRRETNPNVPMRFCATTEEVEQALRTVPPRNLDAPNFGLPVPGITQYDPRAHLIRAIGADEDEVLQAWDLIETEWWVNHLYLDGKKLPTAGVGSLMTDQAKLDALPLLKEGFNDATGAASVAEKRAARQRLTQNAATVPIGLTRRLRACYELTKLHLTDEATRDLLLNPVAGDRARLLAQLDVVLAEYGLKPHDQQPPPLRLALADMIFNMGPGDYVKTSDHPTGHGLRSFPAFFSAVSKGDWRKAATQSRRNTTEEPAQPGIKARNDATQDLIEALSSLVSAPRPLSVEDEVSRRIFHAAGGIPGFEPLRVSAALENGWTLSGPIRWSASIVYSERDRLDSRVFPPGVSTTLSWVVPLTPPVRGGQLRVDVEADIVHADGRTLDLGFYLSGSIRAENPNPDDVRRSLAALPAADPVLPQILLKAIAYHATTQTGTSKSATAFRPFDANGQPLGAARRPDKSPSPFYGLMRLPIQPATADDLWDWNRQVEAARARVATCVKQVGEDQRGVAPTLLLSDEQFTQQVLYYYSQLVSPDDSGAHPYWTPPTPTRPAWVEVNTRLRDYVEAVTQVIVDVGNGATPEGWDA